MPTKQNRAVLLIKDKQIIISHVYLINIHIFDYPDSQLSGLVSEVPTSLDNRGSTVANSAWWSENSLKCYRAIPLGAEYAI